ncbi:aminotransferase class V-fold PLP-dependent enzyme [Crateriforma spongiae]|uniref:aminotransferase class V-fold PLP-dependent enzyme n=1 Tax=Crateriforma spongiae TaxID=2724528 RepID=UPI00144515E7|nr:aminotransferase class V-fold PLP-dependent enzyme [Crateriforma spongiae]
MTDSERLYLDHAATSWPKPAGVMQAVADFALNCGASAGRGAYASAQTAGMILARVRRDLGRLINAPSPDDISLHASGTLALNAAIAGVLRPGDHVVATATEHNSVLRPLHHFCTHRDVDWTVVKCDAAGRIGASSIIDAVEPRTRLVVVSHVSNVTGAVQDISTVADSLSGRDALFLVDAAQSLGWVPVDVQVGIDLLAAPCHKALGGPAGTAMLYCAPAVQAQLNATVFGGTGSYSESLEMPTLYPDRMEAGSVNVPAFAGVAHAVSRLRSDHENKLMNASSIGRQLSERLHAGLHCLPGVTVLGTPSPVPVVSFAIDGMPPADAAAVLDAEFQIEVRAGYHCAALIHSHLPTGDLGTVRVSAGHETTTDQIDRFLQAVEAIAGSMQS